MHKPTHHHKTPPVIEQAKREATSTVSKLQVAEFISSDGEQPA